MQLATALLLLASGCSDYKSSGKGNVTGGGQPVDAGSILFQPIAADVKPAVGVINPDGTYDLKSADGEGLKPGEYKVVYIPPDPPEPDESGKAPPRSKWAKWKVPPDTKVTIGKGENDIPIELKPS